MMFMLKSNLSGICACKYLIDQHLAMLMMLHCIEAKVEPVSAFLLDDPAPTSRAE